MKQGCVRINILTSNVVFAQGYVTVDLGYVESSLEMNGNRNGEFHTSKKHEIILIVITLSVCLYVCVRARARVSL